MLYPFGYKIKTKHQQYTSMGIICLYLLEVCNTRIHFYANNSTLLHFSQRISPIAHCSTLFKRIKRKPYKSFQVL